MSMSMRTRFSIAAPAAVGTIRGSKRSRLVVLALLILPLAACAVGPDFVSPAAPISDNFVGANNRSIKTNDGDYRDWWHTFHDPTLNRLIEIAYEQNLTLLSAGTRVLQARATLGIAIGVIVSADSAGHRQPDL